MSSDQGLSIFDDEPESGDDAGEETQVMPVTPKEQSAAKAAATAPAKAEPSRARADTRAEPTTDRAADPTPPPR